MPEDRAEYVSGTLRCAVCGFEPNEMGETRKKNSLREHIQNHSRAKLWTFVMEKSR